MGICRLADVVLKDHMEALIDKMPDNEDEGVQNNRTWEVHVFSRHCSRLVVEQLQGQATGQQMACKFMPASQSLALLMAGWGGPLHCSVLGGGIL